MIDAERMLGSLVRNAISGGHGGSGGRGRGGRKRGRRRRGSMLGGAGKGALALGALGVAMAAFEHFSDKKTASPTPAGAGAPPPPPPAPAAAAGADSVSLPPLPPLPPPPTTVPAATPSAPKAAQDDALLIVRAMIAAANADHELDDDERRRIVEALDEAEAGEEDKAFLLRELEDPIDLATLAGAARDPELASQVYLASCLAIEVDTTAERNYLDRLAARLGLEPERARELESLAGGEDGGPPETGT